MKPWNTLPEHARLWGRVGRVLVRKLLLRGYKVKALAREHSGAENGKPLPPAVEVVVGDVGDEAACLRAVQGVDKVPGQSHGKKRVSMDCINVPMA